jgi:microfibrillar-associated protein 1
MSSASDPFSILNRNPEKNPFKQPEPKAKVIRYRPGKAPQWEGQDEDTDDIFPNEISNYTYGSDTHSIAESNVTSKEEEKELEAKRRRRVRKTVIIEESDKHGTNKETQEEPEHIIERKEEIVQPNREAITARSELKQKLLEQEQIKEDDILLSKIEEKDELDENEEQDEEDHTESKSLLKPVFVSKHERENQDMKIEEEIAFKEEEKRLRERKKAEAKLLLIEVKKDGAEKDEDNENSDGEMPNDDDEIDEANEYELWKIRELRRIKRDREDKVKRDKEKAEIDRRRKLTDAERSYENKMLGCDAIKPEKAKYKFMQKYYHKGAFYQDSEDDIYKRDFNVAVGDDLWDKSMLPKILQTRRGEFGTAGRSKYTHLTDQDTTNFDPQWKVNEAIQVKNLSKLGGYKGAGILEKPSSKKK